MAGFSACGGLLSQQDPLPPQCDLCGAFLFHGTPLPSYIFSPGTTGTAPSGTGQK